MKRELRPSGAVGFTDLYRKNVKRGVQPVVLSPDLLILDVVGDRSESLFALGVLFLDLELLLDQIENLVIVEGAVIGAVVVV